MCQISYSFSELPESICSTTLSYSKGVDLLHRCASLPTEKAYEDRLSAQRYDVCRSSGHSFDLIHKLSKRNNSCSNAFAYNIY
jgi:hypothetical protein